MPQIEWENSFSTAPPQDVTHQFLEVLNDCFLTQHVTQPTRFRPGETPHILDLILTNEDGMIKNIVHESGLGKSDHVILRFELACYTYQQELPTIHPNYFKGNPDKLNKLLQKVDWDEKKGHTVDVKYHHMTDHLSRIACDCFPKSRRKGGCQNICINGKALCLKAKKKKSCGKPIETHKIYLTTPTSPNGRNELQSLTRKLRREFEENLDRNIKKT